MFKTYQWNSSQLKKKAQCYDWLTILAIVVALGCLRWWSANIALGVLVVMVLFLILSLFTKNKDKQLKKEVSSEKHN